VCCACCISMMQRCAVQMLAAIRWRIEGAGEGIRVVRSRTGAELRIVRVRVESRAATLRADNFEIPQLSNANDDFYIALVDTLS
jgi:hypothetical protein